MASEKTEMQRHYIMVSLFNPHIVRSALRFSKYSMKASLYLKTEIEYDFMLGVLVNLRTHQQDEDRGGGDEKVRERRKSQKERRME